MQKRSLVLTLATVVAAGLLGALAYFGRPVEPPTSNALVTQADGAHSAEVQAPPAPLTHGGGADPPARRPQIVDEPATSADSQSLDGHEVSAPDNPASDVPPEFVVAAWENELEWSMIYEDVSTEELEKERFAIEGFITRSTKEEFKSRFTRGEYEVVGTGKYTLSEADTDMSRIARIVLKGGGGEVQRAELSKSEFPNLYKLRQKSLWLQKEVQARRSAAGQSGNR